MPRTFSGGTSLIGAALTPLSHNTTGDATYTELYVPVTMPTRNANAKLCTPSPPKKYRITTTINTVNTVRIVRLRVWLTASLTIFAVRFGDLPLISRKRSNVTIVSFTEKPMIVSSAATIVRLIWKASIRSAKARHGTTWTM